ncbi:DUF1269 domain-containing protein [Nocardioides sp. CER19]|uniref:DUF1269 domain-containing protein n=1 Tax=Nocardioides sp. CER19 TaxID=3038538 RepID=UPI00244D2609|nr:DUF1269 domain-containing protein [Nocardioides sp. CER19]MDH2415554.1 DUF1269 domain-containing protein [Nocardioides sp. CER19]
MTTFTVWKFEDATEAQRAVKVLKSASADGLVRVVDHAVITWPEGEEKAHVDHSYDDPKRGAAWGTVWGVLTGALFTVPIAGAVVGASLGVMSKMTDGTGITPKDIDRLRDEVTPGTSALFLVTEGAQLDRLGERFHFGDKKLIHTNLTEAERDTLLETFGGS